MGSSALGSRVVYWGVLNVFGELLVERGEITTSKEGLLVLLVLDAREDTEAL